MTRNTKAILKFAVPMVILGVAYFVVMLWITRDQLVGVEEQEPLVVPYAQAELPLDPFDEFWVASTPIQVHLLPQNARVPYGVEERDIWVKSAFNNSEIAFLIEFEDDTEDRIGAPIPDACAVMIGPETSPPIAQMMAQDASGNIWHWRADLDAEEHQLGIDTVTAVLELVTSGPGTQTPLADQTVLGRGELRDGSWHVVLKRALASTQEGGIGIHPDTTMIVSFATWDGSKTEAFAAKSISIVQPLILGVESPE